MPLRTDTSPPRRSYCRFTASEGPRAVDGTAACGPEGVEIALGDDQPLRIWSYPSLASEEPLRANTIDVLLTSREESGAKLFVQGRDFASELKLRAPHLTARRELWRGPWLWLLLLLVGGALLLAVYAAGWSPLKSAAHALPDSWRQRLGDTARESMTGEHRQCADAAGLTALAEMTDRLLSGSPVSEPFTVRVYDWDMTNAFAVPGGQIVLARGLIDKAETPDEVAGVLAHEMGHGIELHPETGIIRGVGLAATIEIMVGGTAGGLANAGAMLAQLAYSRDAEREADRHALELLKGAGVAPKGLADFFTRIMKAEGEEPIAAKNLGPLAWLRTHPPIAERAEFIGHQDGYPSTPALDAQSWRALKDICRTTLDPEKEK